MILTTRDGFKRQNDVIYSITSADEPISLIQLMIIINKLMCNEYRVHKEVIEKNNLFLFKACLEWLYNKVQEDNNFCLKTFLSNESNLKQFCKSFYLRDVTLQKNYLDNVKIRKLTEISIQKTLGA